MPAGDTSVQAARVAMRNANETVERKKIFMGRNYLTVVKVWFMF
jgi:hypothetical protein